MSLGVEFSSLEVLISPSNVEVGRQVIERIYIGLSKEIITLYEHSANVCEHVLTLEFHALMDKWSNVYRI